MTLEKLQSEMVQALKDGNKFRKQVLSELVGAVKKAAIDKKCKDNIPESLVDETLLKYKKTVQEQIDTCPVDRAQMLENYKEQMKIVAEFAPNLITDETEIRYLILDIINNEHEFSKSNRGIFMKILAPVLKKCNVDMRVASKVLGEMLQ
jgi:uncharacterized protein YqeY